MPQRRSICCRCSGNHRRPANETSTTQYSRLPVCVLQFSPEPPLAARYVCCQRTYQLVSSGHHRKIGLRTNQTLVVQATHWRNIPPARRTLQLLSSVLDVVATSENTLQSSRTKAVFHVYRRGIVLRILRQLHPE